MELNDIVKSGNSFFVEVPFEYIFKYFLIYFPLNDFNPSSPIFLLGNTTFDANNRTATGFTGRVNNYAGSNYTYSFSTYIFSNEFEYSGKNQYIELKYTG